MDNDVLANDKHQIGLKNYIWILITGVMNAISLINIGKDFKPAIISWHQAIELVFEKYRQLVDRILYPIEYVINLFIKIEIPDLIKHVFIFFFVLAAIIARSRMITDAQLKDNEKHQATDYTIIKIKDILLLPPFFLAGSIFVILFALYSSFIVTLLLWLLMLVIGEYALSVIFFIYIAITAIYTLFYIPINAIEDKFRTFWGIPKEVETLEDGLMSKYTRNGFVAMWFFILIITSVNFFLKEHY